MTIDPKILSKTVKAIAPKEEVATETQVRGTVVISQGGKYVHLDGAAEGVLTPVVDALGDGDSHGFTHGDRVLVLLKDHQALVTKNISDGLQTKTAIIAGEKADDAWAKAGEAEIAAGEAWAYARDASDAATTANGILDNMQNAALEAGTTLTKIYQDSVDASDAANRAEKAANSAQVELSIVEDVAGTLSWIKDHASYELTTDETVQEGVVYFVYNDETADYEPIISPDPELNPSEEGWYVLNVESSQSDFIMAHLAVTSRGLWVLPNGIGEANDPQYARHYKALLSNDGTYFYDGSGVQVAKYGADAMIGSKTGAHIKLSVEGGYTRMGLWENETSEVAYITNQKLEIRQAVVVDSIEIGNWAWVQKASGTLRLQWISKT